MSDPSTGYVATKLAAMIGGFLGGAAILTFIKPKTIGEAFIRGGTSVGTAIIFATPLLEFLKLSDTWENQAASGFCVGFLAYGILGMIANFFLKNSQKDIFEAFRGK